MPFNYWLVIFLVNILLIYRVWKLGKYIKELFNMSFKNYW